MSLNTTPKADRLHIGIFGKRNSGKSSLINALTDQEAAIVSPYEGTTADPVTKAMELHPIGPVTFIDTAGFDDTGELGQLRVSKTKEMGKKADVAIMVFSDRDLKEEEKWVNALKERETPVILVLNKCELHEEDGLADKISERFAAKVIKVSAVQGTGLDRLKEAIKENMPEAFQRERILGGMVSPGETVLLVMPQDKQAPKGRLILPQAQTIRELLDSKCTAVCTTLEGMDCALNALSEPPGLMITDSQCFSQAKEKQPKGTGITSFSILFAAYKGDIDKLVSGAEAIDSLGKGGRILIAEACTHAPLDEDIGREKIPAMLRKKVGEELEIKVVSGSDFPEDLSGFDLVIHCGACMFNRKYMMERIYQAGEQNVPITNYGIAIAKLKGILDKVDLPI